MQRAVRKPRLPADHKQAGVVTTSGRHSLSKTQEAGRLLLVLGGSLGAMFSPERGAWVGRDGSKRWTRGWSQSTEGGLESKT